MPKNSHGERETKLYLWDLERLDELAAREEITCHCGERLSAANIEAALGHLIAHARSPEQKRGFERALDLYRNWDLLPDAARSYHRAQIVCTSRSDPAEFERLQREGAVVELDSESFWKR